MIIVVDSERSNYVSPHLNNFLSPVHSMSQTVNIQTPRQNDTVPRPDGNGVIGYFYCLCGEHGIDTFLYSHICVRVVSTYQVILKRGDFL